jgi:hypothetical protein
VLLKMITFPRLPDSHPIGQEVPMRRTMILALMVAMIMMAPATAAGQACQEDFYERATDNYSFIASSAQGAIGDVVGIDLSLHVDRPLPDSKLFLFGPIMALCYKEPLLEFTGEIQYTPEFDQLVYSSRVWNPDSVPARNEFEGYAGILRSRARASHDRILPGQGRRGRFDGGRLHGRCPH